MGQRANLIVVEDGRVEIYYTHHRANTLDQDLFWGPKYAVGFIRAQRRMDGIELLDDVWAEGGTVLDLDRLSLLWFGGEEVLYDVALRREHARLMARIWSGWTVRWAGAGVADLADAVGVPRTAVLSDNKEPSESRLTVVDALRTDRPEWSDTIATIRFESGDVHVTRLMCSCHQVLFVGESLIPAISVAGWPVDLSVEWSADDRQIGGFHIDVAVRSIDFWTAGPMGSADVERRVAECWPHWAVHWHSDRFEAQLERTAGRLRITLPSRDVQVKRLHQLLLRPDDPARQSAPEAVIAAAKAISGQTDLTVTGINPWALYDARMSVPLDLRTRLFNAAVAEAGRS